MTKTTARRTPETLENLKTSTRRPSDFFGGGASVAVALPGFEFASFESVGFRV